MYAPCCCAIHAGMPPAVGPLAEQRVAERAPPDATPSTVCRDPIFWAAWVAWGLQLLPRPWGCRQVQHLRAAMKKRL